MAADTPTIFPSLPKEDSVFAAMDRRRANTTLAASQASTDLAGRLSALRDRYPWLQPDVTVALARSGADPDSNIVQQLASLSAKHKSHSGLGWHSIGDVVNATGHLTGKALGKIGDELSFTKPVVRTAALAGQSLYEEAQGLVADVAAQGVGGAALAGAGVGAAVGSIVPGVGTGIGAAVGGTIGGGLGAAAFLTGKIHGHASWEPQSEGAVALQRLLHGQRVDLGSGFIPHPDAAISKEVKSRQTVTIGGHALTPGRLLAAGIVQPGTTPYNVLSGLTDASLALSHYDPAAAVLGETGNVVRNRKLFVDAGGLLADRPTILPEKALEWWNGTSGRAVADAVASEDNPYRIFSATGKKLPVETVRQLAAANTVQKVDDIITPMLGAEIRGPLPYGTFKPLANVRLAQLMPGRIIDLGDDAIAQRDAVLTAERWLKNIKAPQNVIDDTVSKMILAESTPGRFAATTDLMEASRQQLIERGVDPQRATQLTRLKPTAVEGATQYNLSGAGAEVRVPGMYGGVGATTERHLMDAVQQTLTEKWGVDPQRASAAVRQAQDTIDTVRRTATGIIADGSNVPNVAVNDALLDLPQPHLFAEFTDRAVHLPDPRDLRREASRWAPLLTHPAVGLGRTTLEHIQDGIWKPLTLIRGALTARTVGEAQGRMAAAGLDSAFRHPLDYIAWATGRKGAASILGDAFEAGDNQAVLDHLDAFQKAQNRRWAGLKDEKYLPFWRKVSRADPEFTKAWAGELLQLQSDPIAREVARATNGLADVKASFWDGPLSTFRKQMSENAVGLNDRLVAERYVDSIADRINVKTGGNSDLLNAIATGRIGEKDLRDGMRASKTLLRHLDDNTDIAPEFVKGQVSLRTGSIGQRFDDATRRAFSALMAEPQNKLVNSPTFKQYYWDRIRELAPMMNDEARAAAADVARSQDVHDVARLLDKTKGGAHATLSLEHTDAVAKGDALDANWKLLHKLSDRYQFFDAAKLVFPFGDAWAQMLTKWSKIGVEHPEVIRRATQVVDGGEHSGFFYNNGQGEEVFAYPGSGWINEKLFGVRVPFTGRLDGLSMMTEVMPGVGPVVQMPAAALLPDKPDWDWARGALFPFGEPATGSGLLEAFLPAWAQKMRQAGVFSPIGIQRDKGMWNSTVMDVARYLSSTGKYQTDTPEHAADLLDVARTKAKYIYMLRGAAQFFAPSAPTPEWMAKDKGGHLVVVDKLVNEYNDLQQKDPQNATQAMLDRYGDGIFLLLQGKTAEVTPGSVSKSGADWERAHRSVMRAYPEVGALFAPDGGDLDSAAFQRQLDLGNRVRLTPEQAIRLANNRLAATIYYNAKDKFGARPSAAQQDWLGQLRNLLIQKYPGFQDTSGIPQKTDTATMVRQISQAATDPRLGDNPAAKATQLYLAGREKAVEAARAAGLSDSGFGTSRSMQPMREWLRQLGALIVQAHPEFEQIWDRVFSRELTDDNTTAISSLPGAPQVSGASNASTGGVGHFELIPRMAASTPTVGLVPNAPLTQKPDLAQRPYPSKKFT